MNRQTIRAGTTFVVIGVPIALMGLLVLQHQLANSLPNRTANIVFAAAMILAGAAAQVLGWWIRWKGKRTREFGNLEASDFPGLDPKKVEAWLHAQLVYNQAVKRSNWFLCPAILVLVVGGYVGLCIAAISLIGYVLYFLLHVALVGREAGALRKEAGIDRAALKYAMTSKVYRSRRTG